MLINFYPPPIPQFRRRADEKPADYLRRQWIAQAWATASWAERLVFVIAILLWWPTTILHAAYLAARLGPARAKIHGKSPFKQFLEQLAAAAQWLVPPLWYYTFEFCDDAKRARIEDYVHRVQVKPFIYHWLVDRVGRKDRKYPFANKVYFSHICRHHGIAAIDVIALCGGRGIHFTEGRTEFPPVDLFMKIKYGRGGRGAEKWSYVAGRYRNSSGRSLSKAEFNEYVRQRSRLETRIVQHCLVNHSSLSDINLGALATTRILTLRNEHGAIEPVHAVLRMPQRPGAPVDNIHAGGIAAPVDLKTGTLGSATDLGLRVNSRWHERHPETDAPILGRVLPHWQAALDLVCRAHDLIGDRVVVGWDVAILEQGPCIVEGNGKPDVDLMQRPHGIGLGNSRYGELLAYHLKAHLAGETANGRRPAQILAPAESTGS
jgi:Sugar-transfer associated ATP-grasp